MVFYLPQWVCLLNQTGQNFVSRLSSPNFRYFRDENEPKGEPHENEFFYNFLIQKWISQTVRAQKLDEKNRTICLFAFSPSWVMVLKLHKILSFWSFFADVIKKNLGCYSYFYICIWNFSFCSFRKYYCLLSYDLEFRRYSCLKLMNLVKYLLI